MGRKELMAQFNSPARMGTLSTSDGEGNLNAAVFNSLQMVDEDTVVMAIGDNRSLANMRKHPKAVFLFFEPDPNPFDWQGARTYFDVVGIEEEGDLFDRLVEFVRGVAGDQAAQGIKAAITFKITDVRGLIDSGQ
jgi:hypothetical protein